MKLGENISFEVRKEYRERPAFSFYRRWSLGYSPKELAELIRKALPKGGQINVWHDPMMGLP